MSLMDGKKKKIKRDGKGSKAVASHDRSHPEGTQHIKKS